MEHGQEHMKNSCQSSLQSKGIPNTHTHTVQMPSLFLMAVISMAVSEVEGGGLLNSPEPSAGALGLPLGFQCDAITEVG